MDKLVRKAVTWFYSGNPITRYIVGLIFLSIFYFLLLDFVLHVYFYYRFSLADFSQGGVKYKFLEFSFSVIIAFATLSVTSITSKAVSNRPTFTASVLSSDEKFKRFEARADALSYALAHRELALKEGHKQRGALLDAIPDLILQLDYCGNVKCWSDSSEDFSLLFYDISGKNISDFLPDKVVHYCFDKINRALSSDSVQVFEFELTHETEIYIFEARVAKIDNFNVMMIFRNLTEIRSLEKQKTRQANMFEHMADNLPELLWCKDLLDRYVFINKFYKEFLFEQTSVSIIGNVISTEYTNEETVKNIKESDYLVKERRVPLRFILRHTRQDKSYLWLDVYKSPWWSNTVPNKIIGIVGSARDITDCMPHISKEKLKTQSIVEVSFEQCFHWTSIDPACNACMGSSEND